MGIGVLGLALKKLQPFGIDAFHQGLLQRVARQHRKTGAVHALAKRGSSVRALEIDHGQVHGVDLWRAGEADQAGSQSRSIVASNSALQALASTPRHAVLLGNAAAHHAKAASLLALANWIADLSGATVGYLTEAANTVGAQFACALPGPEGLNAGQMLAGGLKGVLLLNTEPEFDSGAGSAAAASLGQARMVVTLSPFKANMAFSDVLLPIAPFTETSGTFVNAEGRVQGFHAVVKPLGETRPAWKVLRVLANVLGLPDFDFDSSLDVLRLAPALSKPGVTHIPVDLMSNATQAAMDTTPVPHVPVVAGIYALDGLVRRASSLQMTADARSETAAQEVAA